ncbi:MAG: aminotransferase class I/II-fold pyridoxal phosphate-dependent enzyme, partial [Lachnospiraceae bacterium]|nr:aminotransferase class I/II-fold pyridoxal phosphate-dependent enzyme [Lachnospiraceae bacterium]
MQAVILAAGMGKRLKELTKNNTKCMVKVNHMTLIERLLGQLDRRNLSRIIIVAGYKADELTEYIGTLSVKTPICFLKNPVYDKTNNIYSLSLAQKELCEDDTLLFESDIIFEDSVLDTLLEDPRENLALVDKYESWMDGTCVVLGDDDTIEQFIPGRKFRFEDSAKYHKTVNIYKFSKSFSKDYYVPFMNAYLSAVGENEYYEQVLRVITLLDEPVIRGKRLDGHKWYEIDDIQDLDIASALFAGEEEDKVGMLEERFGGYWRYPGMLDFCYLVTPYYPTQRLLDELRSSFDKLLTAYPSGMKVNSLLAAKNFDVHPENIIVGNGAAELIKSLMEHLDGLTGVVRPTFEEYPNRYDDRDLVVFEPDRSDFQYGVDDLIAFFEGTDIKNLILINPDNPTGNYIPEKDLLRLITWADNKNIRLVIDESFADFAEDGKITQTRQEMLDRYKRLYFMKSISKSHGVPGLRLGIMMSGDLELIAEMKNDVAIWNINSFAEFYMQIMEKYRADHAQG